MNYNIYPCRNISAYVRILLKESTHDRVVASRAYHIRREVRDMSDAELITIYIAILSLLVATSTLTVTFLAYLKPEPKRKKRKKK